MVNDKDQSSRLVYLKQQTCENLSSIGRRNCEITMKEKTLLTHKVVCFQMLDFETSFYILRSRNQIRMQITYFLENYVTSEGAVSHNVLYYQSLSITHYQVRFYANNYFE